MALSDTIAATQKSTSVRFMSPLLPLLSALGTFAPTLASGVVEQLLFVPRGRRKSTRGEAFLATGRREERVVDGIRLIAWRWGSGPAVFCVHGWAGSAAQFRTIVPALTARGMQVIAFDAAGHGHSGGRRSSIVAMRDALQAFAATEPGPLAVIAHSGGAAAVTLAMRDGLTVERAIFVGPTVDPGGIMEQNALAAGLSANVITALKRRIHQRFGMPWTALRILPIAASRREPLLVVHDKDDEEVPWTEGADLVDAWPTARLLLTRGLGHRRILYDKVVANAIAQFVVQDGDLYFSPGDVLAG